MTSHQTDTSTPSMSVATRLNVIGLLGFGALIVVQIIGGVDVYPLIPPGLVISLVVVALVVFGHAWRWTAVVGVVLPVFLTVGAFLAAGSMEALSGDAGTFVQVTSIVQRLWLAVALVGGAVAVWQRYRPSRPV